MSKLIQLEIKKFPAVRIIGKQVRINIIPDGNNLAANLWNTMQQDGSLDCLNNLPGRLSEAADTIGWRGEFDLSNGTCCYIAGVMAKEGTTVPDGFIYRDLPESLMAIAQIRGREEKADLYIGAREHLTHTMKEYGYEKDDVTGGYEIEYYSFNRFNVPRYIGERILILDFYTPCRKIQAENEDVELVIKRSKLKNSFDNLAQRIVYAYKSTYPDYIPIEDDRASESSQRQLHGFLQDTICRIYDHPSLINLKEEKDEFFEDFVLNNSNQILIDAMRDIESTLLDFYSYLYKLGEAGEVRENKLYISKDKMKFVKKRLLQLEQFGLFCETKDNSTIFYSKKYPALFPAWKLLYERKRDTRKGEIIRFLYGMFDSVQYKAEHLYGDISESRELINALEKYFMDMGFHHSCDEFGVHWTKEYPNKQKGKADFSFDWRRRNPITFTFHVPNFRMILSQFDGLSNELKELTFSRTKNCDGCGYCTQMDKSGKRKPLVLNIERSGRLTGKCPLFPNLTWRYIDEKEVERIIHLYDYAEQIS